MKIEVGMYVRTNKGLIFKIEAVNDCDIDGTWYKSEGVNQVFRDILLSYEVENYERIEKASYNIIDLIEVGDYVNGYLIDYINLDFSTPFIRSNRPYRNDNYLYSTLMEKGKEYNMPLNFYKEDIKSIVTKEQFESMKYEVTND